jgi:hypothetical protein
MLELVNFLPTDHRHLMRTKGIGKGKAKRYGEAILKIIENYSRENHCSVNIASSADAPKPSSADQFYDISCDN